MITALFLNLGSLKETILPLVSGKEKSKSSYPSFIKVKLLTFGNSYPLFNLAVNGSFQ